MTTLSTNSYALIGVLLLNLGIALYVLWSDPRDRVHQVFFIFVAGIVLWVSGFVLILFTHLFIFDKFIIYGGLVMFLGLFLLSQIFPKRLPIPVSPWFLYAPFAIAAIAVIPWNLINTGMEILPSGEIRPVVGPLQLPYNVMLLCYLGASIWCFIGQYRRSEARTRLQLKYFFLGIGVAGFGALIFDGLLPSLGNTSLNLVGPFMSVVFVGSTAYAIIRHELMDIRVVIQRGLIYTSLLVLITAGYLSVINLLGLLFGEDSKTMFLSALITTVVGIYTVPKIEQYFKRITDSIFFKDTYDYAEALQTLTECLYSAVEIDDLFATCQEHLAHIFKTDLALIVPASNAEPSETVLTIPIKTKEGLLGNIFLGEKRSGDPYTSEDRHLLETFAFEAAIALGRAMLYKQVAQHAAELEQKVKERTSELREAQDTQAHMLLDISHGLQTPLTVFQTKLEQLKQTRPNDTELQQFEKSLADISNFIYNLLKLARLENNQEEIALERVSLTSLLEEIVEEVRTIAAMHGIAIRHSAAADVYVNGDAKKIRDVIMNLASNSIKYMRREGKKEITFTLGVEGTVAVLSISDTGVGIAAEYLPFIFERFYRVQGSPGRINGSGLGLAISKHIVEQHGGTLTAQSELGVGTTITIRLPLAV